MSEIQSQILLNAQKFQIKFNIRFTNQDLLIQALKHRSYLVVSNEKREMSNERLEFLGDSILNFTLTEYLFMNYPDYAEGQLSKMKSVLVSQRVLGQVAQNKGYGDYILMNFGEEKSGGRDRYSVLSDVYEALLAAIYLDKGLEHAKKLIQMDILDHHKNFLSDLDLKNYKSILLELLQGKGISSPTYKLVAESGPDHDKSFLLEVYSADICLGRGHGSSKKDAAQEASRHALQNIESGEVQL